MILVFEQKNKERGKMFMRTCYRVPFAVEIVMLARGKLMVRISMVNPRRMTEDLRTGTSMPAHTDNDLSHMAMDSAQTLRQVAHIEGNVAQTHRPVAHIKGNAAQTLRPVAHIIGNAA